MGHGKFTQVSFLGGEVSPRLEGRRDLVNYDKMCKRLENGFLWPHGAFQSRSGSQHLASTKSDQYARLIPYTATDGTVYELEFTDYLIRVYKNKVLLGAPYEIVSPYASGWNIDGLIYDTVSPPVAGPVGFPYAMAFSSDGTSLYIGGEELIRRYVLSTPWDVSTATNPAGAIVPFGEMSGNVVGIAFNDTGTKLYVADDGNNKIYQYSVATPWVWDGGVTYDSKFLSINPLRGFYLRSNGVDLFVPSSTGIRYSQLGTPWDISTAVLVSILTVTDVSAPSDVFFNTDGTRMFVLGETFDSLYQYLLSTAWDITTATFTGKSFSLTDKGVDFVGMWFKSDGTVFYGLNRPGIKNTNKIFQYNIEAYEIKELQYVQEGANLYITHLNHKTRKLRRISDINWKLETVYFDIPPMEAMPERYTQTLTIRVGTDADTTVAVTGQYVYFTVAAGGPDSIPQAGKVLVAGTGKMLILGMNENANGHAYAGANLKGVGFVLEAFDTYTYTSWYLLGNPYAEITLNADVAGAPVGTNVRITPTATGGIARFPLSYLGTWTLSAALGNNTYYLNTNIGAQPANVYENNKLMAYVVLGAMSEGQWGWGNLDAIGFNTIYVRISRLDNVSTYDPDGTVGGRTGAYINASFASATYQNPLKLGTSAQRSFLLMHDGVIEVLGQFTGSAHAYYRQYYGVVLNQPTALTATYAIETLFEPWNDTDGYPAACAIHEDRLVLGGTIFQPHTIWESDTGDFEVFTPGVAASNSISLTLAPRERSPIKWLEAKDVLIAGTDRGEWIVGERGVATTPSNVFARQHSAHGCAARKPLIVQDVVVFIERGQKRLRAFRYAQETDSYMAEDLSMFAEHLFTNTTIEEIAYVRLPFPAILVITGDGRMCMLSFMRDLGAFAWGKWETGATAAGVYDTSDHYESVCVVKGTNYDDVYVVVKRTINGATVRFVECFADIFTSGTATDVVALDCYTVDTGLSATVSGLSRFNGDVVKYIVDGDKTKIGTATVSGGAITMSWTPTVKAVIGLPFTALVQTMRVDSGATGALGIGLKKVIKQEFVRLYNTIGGKVGPDEANDALGKPRAQAIPNATTIFTDDRKIDGIKGSPEVFEDSRVTVFQDEPLPLTVLAIQANTEVNE